MYTHIRVKSEDIDNGMRYWFVEYNEVSSLPLEKRFVYVDVHNDEKYFTVRDIFDKPVGTITRPRYNERGWSSYDTSGHAHTRTAVGPRHAFRTLLKNYLNS